MKSPSSLTSPARVLTSAATLPANRLSLKTCRLYFRPGTSPEIRNRPSLSVLMDEGRAPLSNAGSRPRILEEDRAVAGQQGPGLRQAAAIDEPAGPGPARLEPDGQGARLIGLDHIGPGEVLRLVIEEQPALPLGSRARAPRTRPWEAVARTISA